MNLDRITININDDNKCITIDELIDKLVAVKEDFNDGSIPVFIKSESSDDCNELTRVLSLKNKNKDEYFDRLVLLVTNS